MKRVLIIAYYFPPLGLAGVNRPLHLFKYLPQHGWEPHILTVKPVAYAAYEPELLNDLDQSRIHRSTDYWLRRRLSFLSQIAPLGSFRERLRTSRFGQKIFAALNTGAQDEPFPDALYRWAPFAIEKGKQLLCDFDFNLILSTSPPITSHLVGRQLHMESKLPWVADFRDFWSENRDVMPYQNPELIQQGNELLKSIRSEASQMVAVNATYQRLLGADAAIHNSYDDDRANRWLPPPPLECVFRLGMIGNMSPRTWQPIVDLLLQCKRLDREGSVSIEVHHVGDDHAGRGRRAFLDAGLENQLISYGRQSRNRSIELLNTTHALFIGLDANTDNHLTPARVFDYLAAGRDVIATSGATSELARLVRDVSYVSWYDVRESARGGGILKQIISGVRIAHDRDDLFTRRRVESRQFSATVMAGKFASLFDTIV